MSAPSHKFALVFGFTAVLAAAGGYVLGRLQSDHGMTAPPPGHSIEAAADAGQRVLYWYDPMHPTQHFDAPGKSPFMDMDLVPKYADEGAAGDTLRIDPSLAQNLGIRTAKVERGMLPDTIDAVGTFAFNARDVAVVQARADAFVERVYDRAPDDVVARGTPLADLLIPSWIGAGTELLALRRHADPSLLAAARERLRLLGAPPELIARVEANGTVEATVTVATPIAGVIRQLDVRAGMSVRAGDTLARINGIDPVWLDIAVAESASGRLKVNDAVTARLRAFPGETFSGRVVGILPETRSDTRTVTVRSEMPNPDGRLRPGMFAEVRIAAGNAGTVLLVPSEAVIRTGRRALVFLAGDDGRYRPRTIETGREGDGMTTVLAGLEEGDAVVASGQFLVDSEASLAAVLPADESMARPAPDPRPVAVEAEVAGIETGALTLRHPPLAALGLAQATTRFALAAGVSSAGIAAGDRVLVRVRAVDGAFVVERISRAGDQP